MVNSGSTENSLGVNAESRQEVLVAGTQWQWQRWYVVVKLGCI